MKFPLQCAPFFVVVFAFVSKLSFSQDCDLALRIITRQDARMYSTPNHLLNDQYGDAFTMTALTADSAVALIFDFVDKELCVDDSARVQIEFTDGTVFEDKNHLGKNCEARSAIYFSGGLRNIDQFEQFSQKVIKSAEVWTTGKASQRIRIKNPDLAERMRMSFRCLMDRVGETLPPLPSVVDVAGDSNKVFVVVEVQPEFEGGPEAMMKYLKKNLRINKRNSMMGTVFTSFVVEKDGSIGDVKILRGLNPEIDREAIRVISSMPHWKPGRQNNKPVRVRFVMPLKF